jgi:4-oxalocrotonate tautomerase
VPPTDGQTVHARIANGLALSGRLSSRKTFGLFRGAQVHPFARRRSVPLIQVRIIKDVFTKEQKKQIISKLTDAMVSIEGENMRQVTWCVVEEVESGDWGIAGNPLTTADVHALAHGKAA